MSCVHSRRCRDHVPFESRTSPTPHVVVFIPSFQFIHAQKANLASQRPNGPRGPPIQSCPARSVILQHQRPGPREVGGPEQLRGRVAAPAPVHELGGAGADLVGDLVEVVGAGGVHGAEGGAAAAALVEADALEARRVEAVVGRAAAVVLHLLHHVPVHRLAVRHVADRLAQQRAHAAHRVAAVEGAPGRFEARAEAEEDADARRVGLGLGLGWVGRCLGNAVAAVAAAVIVVVVVVVVVLAVGCLP